MKITTFAIAFFLINISRGMVSSLSYACRLSSTRHVTLMNTAGHEHELNNYKIERVENRELFYRLSVFRYRNIPLEEYLANNNHLSKDQALMLLTSTKCDDAGQDLWFSEPRDVGVLTQFVAVSAHDNFGQVRGTNDVVGSVDILLRETHSDDESSEITTATILELRNLSVHTSLRRMGIASQLVDTVQKYAQTLNSSAVVYLNVAFDNNGARALYERKGFQVDPSDFERMFWNSESLSRPTDATPSSSNTTTGSGGHIIYAT